MYRKPCIDVTQFCNDLCIGHNVAMIRDTFVALWCSPIHAEPTGFAVNVFFNSIVRPFSIIKITKKKLKLRYMVHCSLLLKYIYINFNVYIYSYHWVLKHH